MSSDEDARLVYADQLTLAGDPRGELLVAQCELARGGLSRSRAIALRKIENLLLTAHGAAWSGLEGIVTTSVFRRGVVDDITVDADVLLAREEEIFERAPQLRWVRITGLVHDPGTDDISDDSALPPRGWPLISSEDWRPIRDKLERILASGRVRYFDPTDARVLGPVDRGDIVLPRSVFYVGEPILDWLLETRRIEHLEGLALRATGVEALSVLARDPAALRLEEVSFAGSGIGTFFEEQAGLHSHFHATALRPRSLHLSERADSAERESLAALLATPLFERVVDLELTRLFDYVDSRLSFSDPSIAGPLLLAGLSFTQNLRRLRGRLRFTASELEAIARAPELAALEELSLAGPKYRLPEARDITPLFDPPRLDSLRVLHIDGGLDLDMARALLASPLARRLEVIDLRPSNLGPSEEELRDGWDGLLLV